MDKKKIVPYVEDAVNGDMKALNKICELCVKDVIYICAGMTGSLHDGEDAAQEVFYKLQKNVRNLRNAGGFFAWFNRTIYNTCIDVMREKTAGRSNVAMDDMYDEMPESKLDFLPADFIEQEEMQQLMSNCMEQLAPQYKQVLLMTYYQDMAPAEISEVLSVPVDKIYNKLYFAKKSLKQKMEEQSGGTALSNAFASLGSGAVISSLMKNQARQIVTKESVKHILGYSSGFGKFIQLSVIPTLKSKALITVCSLSLAVAAAGGLAVYTKTAANENMPDAPTNSSQSALTNYADDSHEAVFSPVPEKQEPEAEKFPSFSDEDSSISEESSEISEMAEEGSLPVIGTPQTDNSEAPASIPEEAPAPTPPPEYRYKVTGSVLFADISGTAVSGGEKYSAGMLVEAYHNDEAVGRASVEENGAYSLEFISNTIIDSYTLKIHRESSGQFPFYDNENDSCILDTQGFDAVAQTVYITDNTPPSGIIVNIDALGNKSQSHENPAQAVLEMYDASECNVIWEIYPQGSDIVLASGEGLSADIPARQLIDESGPGYFNVVYKVKDLTGNSVEISKEILCFE